jgi:hypothetical protein
MMQQSIKQTVIRQAIVEYSIEMAVNFGYLEICADDPDRTLLRSNTGHHKSHSPGKLTFTSYCDVVTEYYARH